ncbi:hypothetical protein CRE_08887 [Caenorhabditis remanei]|uniref:Uncharacterized protein n=1 Tax=Caenorhabditis remanei TaxID=31234 RepID=E3LI32_CAERE|nr:hypothetical protein CRE_08887 [Caenorhabditis remanei]
MFLTWEHFVWSSQENMPLLVGLGLFNILIILIWFISVVPYYWIFNKNRDNWKELSDYPIFLHANYILKRYFPIFQVISVAQLVVFGFLINTDYSSLLLVGFGVPLVFFSYVIIVFRQVHQALIAFSFVEDVVWCREEPLSKYEIGVKQIEKKLWIRYLWKIFIAKDFILITAVYFHDRNYSFYYTQLISISIIDAFVPLALFCWVFKKLLNRGLNDPQRALNPLQRQIKYQILTITAIQIMFWAFTVILNYFDCLPDENVNASILSLTGIISHYISHYMSHIIGFILPTIIQVTCWVDNMSKSRESAVRSTSPGIYSIS